MSTGTFEMEIKSRCCKCSGCYSAKCHRVRSDFGRCYSRCPFLSSVKLTPRQVAYRFDPSDEEAIKLVYSCMQCGLCSHAICPKGLKPKEMFLKYREALVYLGKGPMTFHRFLYMHEEWNFFTIFKEEYGGLQQPPLEGTYEYVFFPGCALSTFTPWLVEKTREILASKLGKVGLLLDCCYLPLENIGLREAFTKNLGLLRKKLDELGSPKIIVACPNCFREFKRNLSGYHIYSVYEMLMGHPFKLKTSGSIAIHDSCPFRYYPDQLNAIREIFRSNGINPIELNYSKDLTLCCGAGGGVPYASPDLSSKLGEMIVSDAKRKGADILVTYCSTCLNQFSVFSQKYGTKLLHVLDLITGCESDYNEISRKVQNLFTEPKWTSILSKLGLSE